MFIVVSHGSNRLSKAGGNRRVHALASNHRWRTDSRGFETCRETGRDAFKVSLWTARSPPAILSRSEPRRQARLLFPTKGKLSQPPSSDANRMTKPRQRLRPITVRVSKPTDTII